MNQRTKIELKPIDIILFKYLRCNCYKLFKGPKYYLGKIVFEGEQRLKNEADFGNLVQIVRRNKVVGQSLLDKDSYMAMKFQQCKLLEFPTETPPTKKMFVADDSNINNEASIQDLRDYAQL